MTRWIVPSIAVAVAACAAPDTTPPTEVVSQPITGGQLATECQWPTTVLLSGCTGTLVHPSIVTTAAHCGTKHKTATFGETRTRAARTVPIEYCRTFPRQGGPPVAGNTLKDWAFCKLAQPVTDVPIVPILMGCEADILKPGQKVVVAGFGQTESNAGGFGTKRWVETTVNVVDKGRGIQVGGMGKAPCFGDSGGPAFVKLPDGTWRVFGIDSSGTAESCAAGDLMALIHKGVPWIEQSSGIDITPCHDADGTWHPSAGCGAFPLAPDGAGRTWARGCAEVSLSPPSATCGPASTETPADAAATASPDATPPPVATLPPDATVPIAADGPLPPPPHVGEDGPPPSRDAAGPVAPSMSGGCGCALPSRPPGGSPLLVLAVAAFLAARRRR